MAEIALMAAGNCAEFTFEIEFVRLMNKPADSYHHN